MSVLIGMKEICQYRRRSESTILNWIRQRGFPAKQDKKNATWESHTELIDKWDFDRFEKEKPESKEVTRPDIKKTVRRGKRNKK